LPGREENMPSDPPFGSALERPFKTSADFEYLRQVIMREVADGPVPIFEMMVDGSIMGQVTGLDCSVDRMSDTIEKLTALFVAAIDKAAAHPSAGFIIYADDMGFKTSTMLSPDFFRKHILPGQKRCAEACHRHGMRSRGFPSGEQCNPEATSDKRGFAKTYEEGRGV
jgi:hypothetical protein